jgi:hypothetical protein
MTEEQDPLLIRRARIARWAEVGQRLGYALFGVAVLLFVLGAVAGFSSPVVVGVVAALAGGSAVLAPAIVFGFAVKAAEREDRQREDRQRDDGQGRDGLRS